MIRKLRGKYRSKKGPRFFSIFICSFCEKTFTPKYRHNQGLIPKFCSIQCNGFAKAANNSKLTQTCQKCKQIKTKDKFEKYFNINNDCHYRTSCFECRSEYQSYRQSEFAKKHGMSYSSYKKHHSMESHLKILVSLARGRARTLKREFSLTKEDILKLYITQNKKCAVSGVELTHNALQGHCPTNASIDRIDSSIGYILSNVQLVCYMVNSMKNTLSMRELTNWCQTIVDHMKEKHETSK